MGLLPDDITITLGPDDPVPSALLNELQAGSKGHWIPELPINIHPLKAYATVPANVTFDFPGQYQLASGNQQLYIPVDLYQGDEITKVEVDFYGNGAGTFNIAVYKRTALGVISLLSASANYAAPSASWQTGTYTPPLTSVRFVGAGESHAVTCFIGNAHRMGNVRVFRRRAP